MVQDFSQFPLVVVVSSNEVERIAIREILINSGHVYVAGVAGEALELGRFLPADPDIVLLDVGYTSADVPAMVREARGILPRCDVILIAGPEAKFDLSDKSDQLARHGAALLAQVEREQAEDRQGFGSDS